MKYQVNSTLSDIIIVLYLVGTLWLRFQVEPQLNGNALISVLVGGLALLFLWAMIKSKFLRPSYFGLFGPGKKEV